MALTYAVVICVVSIWLAGQQTLRLLQARRSREWPSVDGELDRGEPRLARGTIPVARGSIAGYYWMAILRYTYSVGRRQYTGRDELHLGPAMRIAKSFRRPDVTLPRHSTVRVYYDPDRPERAVLEPGAPVSLYVEAGLAWIAALGLTAIVAGAA